MCGYSAKWAFSQSRGTRINPSPAILPEKNSVTAKVSLPVAVVLEKHVVSGTFRLNTGKNSQSQNNQGQNNQGQNNQGQQANPPSWQIPSWKLHAVLVGEHLTSSSADGEKLDSGGGDHYLWSGMRVVLFKDACERYWHALIGERPLVYVVLREDEADGTIEPALVTIDYDEATAHSETDGQVLTADIPPELYTMMETFVLEHYQPVEFKKRKRKKWKNAEHADSLEQADGDDVWSAVRRFRRPGYHD